MSKGSCRRALDADHGPLDDGHGSLFGPLGPPGPFFAVSENSLFRAKFRPPTWPPKASFLHPLEGPKNQICDQTPRKTAIFTLAPWAEKGPVQKHLGRRRAPKGALFGSLDRSVSDPFLYLFFLSSRHPSRAPFFNSSCPPRGQI